LHVDPIPAVAPTAFLVFLLKAAPPPPIFKLVYVQEMAMGCGVISVHFDSRHLFLDLSGGRAVLFPLKRFPILQAATSAEREHFAISMDRKRLLWPEIDEEIEVSALFSHQPETAHH
jgi:Protein of unknown function (DUF2442)